jgi:hypothetical protein
VHPNGNLSAVVALAKMKIANRSSVRVLILTDRNQATQHPINHGQCLLHLPLFLTATRALQALFDIVTLRMRRHPRQTIILPNLLGASLKPVLSSKRTAMGANECGL